ncbi:hypothetical protein [Natronococcus pandeyae]|uniref:hypothetical protein n=1 Tax=Natronococcus pandeyae TaxID=2055836 RepID=UPI0011E892D1|nr:hypothetical protein [Natronococcus pandeyae]
MGSDDKSTPPFTGGDRIEMVIPHPNDRSHRHHGKQGTVTNVTANNLSELTGNPCDDWIIDVRLDDGTTLSVRARELRSPGSGN